MLEGMKINIQHYFDYYYSKTFSVMHTAAILLINLINLRTVVCIATLFGMEQNSVIKIF